MKKLVYVVMLLLLVNMALGVSILGLSTNYDNPNSVDLKVNIVNQEPDPVDPGSNVLVRFKVENYGTVAAENITLEVVPDLPLHAYGNTQTVIPSISGLQMGDDKIIISFNLKTDADTPATVGRVYVRYKTTADSSWTKVGPFNITIRNADSTIGIEDFSITPAVISPGEAADISFKIRNTGQSVLNDVKVTLDLEATTIPFVPELGTNQKSIGKIDAASYKDVVFTIRALPDATASAYKVPLEITYRDNLGKNYTIDSLIGIVVGDQPDVLLSIESTKIQTKNSPGELNLQIVNKGLTDIKFMTIEALESDDYDIISNKVVYLGKIESDDYETAKYSYYIKSDKADVPLLYRMVYKDTNNNEYTLERQVNLHIYSSSELRKYGLAPQQSYTWLVILVIIIAGVGYYIYRRRKKPKHH